MRAVVFTQVDKLFIIITGVKGVLFNFLACFTAFDFRVTDVLLYHCVYY